MCANLFIPFTTQIKVCGSNQREPPSAECSHLCTVGHCFYFGHHDPIHSRGPLVFRQYSVERESHLNQRSKVLPFILDRNAHRLYCVGALKGVSALEGVENLSPFPKLLASNIWFD